MVNFVSLPCCCVRESMLFQIVCIHLGLRLSILSVFFFAGARFVLLASFTHVCLLLCADLLEDMGMDLGLAVMVTSIRGGSLVTKSGIQQGDQICQVR